MTPENRKPTDEAQIRQLVDDWIRAIRAKDVDGLMAHYAPDVLSFDAVNPLQNIGAAACRKRVEAWFSSYRSPIGFEMRDLSITTAADVAFSHSLYRVSGTLLDGGDITMWVRLTVCYRKIDGTWVVTHEHTSVPFDPESGKASLDLKP